MEERLRALAKKSPKALERALYKEAQIEMTEMKRQTPVEFGTLRDSGLVEQPRWVNGSTLVVELGFGGAAEDYAIYVHEDLDAFHAVGNAKFVEIPLNDSKPYMARRVAERWAKDLGI
jgi:hypothetical protein